MVLILGKTANVIGREGRMTNGNETGARGVMLKRYGAGTNIFHNILHCKRGKVPTCLVTRHGWRVVLVRK